jgi:5-methylcytosine-specific restriction endonuclease McrA
MSDRRYSTARWQRLRKAVLAYYGYVCQVEGPRCTGYATTVHHILPSSQYPELFWNPENLEAACSPCNYGDGSRIAAENTRHTIERLRALVEEQQQEIDRLLETIARYEDAKPAKRPAPAIH